MRPLLLLLLLPAGVYAGLCLLMYLTQRSQIYFPVRASMAPGAAPLQVDVEGAQIKVWTVSRPDRAALLYFGGNAEDVGASIGRFAARLASVREVRRLVLVTPFDSLVNVARAHLPWMPVSLLMRDRYDSASRAPEVSSRTLVVIAEADEIVPRAASEALVLAFRERPRVVVLEGAGHNGIDLDPGYLEEVAAFLGR